jgi:hypothetical protein
MSEATMTPTEAMAITREPERYTVQERKDAKKVLAKVGSQGADFTENTEKSIARENAKSRGGKTAMMRGGMANGKQHMYAAGGSVTDNAGLRALKKASPEAYNKITRS